MAWSTALSRPEWRDWLLTVAGSSPVRSGAKLDPFGTSWRVLSTQARRWLPRIRAGTPVEGTQRRIDQTIIDLRAANLVAGPPARLTALGEAVLDRWEPLGETWEYELPLGVALLQEALIAEEAEFRDMLAFWWDIRQRFGGDERVLADGAAVLLLPYLNRTVDGFNPWVELRSSSGELVLPVPWDELEAAGSGGADVRDALRRLKNVLDPSRRLKARVVFCRAMTLLFLRRENIAGLGPYLSSLKLPPRVER